MAGYARSALDNTTLSETSGTGAAVMKVAGSEAREHIDNTMWKMITFTYKWAPGLENECPGLEKHQKIDLPDLGNEQKKDHSAYKKQDF